MKKAGILNANLSEIVAGMGHGDKLVISDAGLPIPHDCRKVDLALTKNIPCFWDTLRTVLKELEVESVIVAEELLSMNDGIYNEISKLLPNADIKCVNHEEFKSIYRKDPETVFVRTGEASPYTNIILISGVTFG